MNTLESIEAWLFEAGLEFHENPRWANGAADWNCFRGTGLIPLECETGTLIDDVVIRNTTDHRQAVFIGDVRLNFPKRRTTIRWCASPGTEIFSNGRLCVTTDFPVEGAFHVYRSGPE